MVSYEIYLDDVYGERIALLDQFESLSWARRLNGIGSFSLKFARDKFDRDKFGLDRRVEIWRKVEGGTSLLMLVGFLRYLEQGLVGSDFYTIIAGPDAMDLLQRRIIAYAAGSSGAQKSGYAGNIIKAFVDENLESGAIAARDLSSLGFSVEANLNDGYNPVGKGASRRALLLVLQEIAEASAQRGTRLYFDIDYPTPSTFQFRTYAGQRGQDRTYPDGTNPVILSAEAGTLADPILVQDWREEATYCYAAGQGEGADRYVVEISDATRLGASIWNRREVLFDGRIYDNPAALGDAGRNCLRELKPLRRFSARMVDTNAIRFGRDVYFGDRVTASFAGEQFDVDIAAIGATVTREGEYLDIRLETTE